MPRSVRISSRLPLTDLPPRRNSTVRFAFVWSLEFVGIRPRAVIRSDEQGVGSDSGGQRKSWRVRGTAGPDPLAQTILRPGQIEMTGAFDAGVAATGFCASSRLVAGSV